VVSKLLIRRKKELFRREKELSQLRTRAEELADVKAAWGGGAPVLTDWPVQADDEVVWHHCLVWGTSHASGRRTGRPWPVADQCYCAYTSVRA